MYIFHSSDPLLGNHRFSLFLYIKDRNSTIIIFRLCTFSKQPAAPFLNRCGTHPLCPETCCGTKIKFPGQFRSDWFQHGSAELQTVRGGPARRFSCGAHFLSLSLSPWSLYLSLSLGLDSLGGRALCLGRQLFSSEINTHYQQPLLPSLTLLL